MRDKNDRPIKSVLKDMLDQYKLKSKFTQVKINNLWTELMGPSIAGYTKDIMIRRKKMYITIDSAPLRQELSYSKEKIKNLINEALEEEYLVDVIIR